MYLLHCMWLSCAACPASASGGQLLAMGSWQYIPAVFTCRLSHHVARASARGQFFIDLIAHTGPRQDIHAPCQCALCISCPCCSECSHSAAAPLKTCQLSSGPGARNAATPTHIRRRSHTVIELSPRPVHVLFKCCSERVWSEAWS